MRTAAYNAIIGAFFGEIPAPTQLSQLVCKQFKADCSGLKKQLFILEVEGGVEKRFVVPID